MRFPYCCSRSHLNALLFKRYFLNGVKTTHTDKKYVWSCHLQYVLWLLFAKSDSDIACNCFYCLSCLLFTSLDFLNRLFEGCLKGYLRAFILLNSLSNNQETCTNPQKWRYVTWITVLFKGGLPQCHHSLLSTQQLSTH